MKIIITISIVSFVFIFLLCLIFFFLIPSIPNYDLQNYYLHKNHPISKINDLKAIYFHDEWLYLSDGDKIFRSNDYGITLDFVANIEHSIWYLNILKKFYITTRIARLDVYRMRILSTGTIIFTTREGIFRVNSGEKIAKLAFKTKGSRPISLTVDKNGVVYFGEYHSNPNRDPISVFASNDDGKSFSKIYTFPANTIRHIHAVEYDKYDDCLWLATGDSDRETYLIKASLDFKKVETIAHGGQKNRYFEIKVFQDKIFMTPDSPTGNNAIRLYDKNEKQLKKILDVEAPVFFSTKLGDYYFCATSNEPYAKKGKTEYLASHIWVINSKTLKSKKIGIFGVDILYRISIIDFNPIKSLFQFSQPYFPEGEVIEKNKLIVYGNGLKNFWNNTYIWDVSNLDF